MKEHAAAIKGHQRLHQNIRPTELLQSHKSFHAILRKKLHSPPTHKEMQSISKHPSTAASPAKRGSEASALLPSDTGPSIRGAELLG